MDEAFTFSVCAVYSEHGLSGSVRFRGSVNANREMQTPRTLRTRIYPFVITVQSKTNDSLAQALAENLPREERQHIQFTNRLCGLL